MVSGLTHATAERMGQREDAQGRVRGVGLGSLAGAVNALSVAGESGEIAVRVIDDHGNEFLVVKPLAEAT